MDVYQLAWQMLGLGLGVGVILPAALTALALMLYEMRRPGYSRELCEYVKKPAPNGKGNLWYIESKALGETLWTRATERAASSAHCE